MKRISLSRTLLYAVLLFLSFIFLFPLYLAVINSLAPWFNPPTAVPTAFKWENYYWATELIDFWRYARNSLIIAIIYVPLTTLSSGLSGFAFARLRAPGSKVLFLCVLSTMMLPGIVTQIPTYILFFRFNLINTYIPWLVWGIGGSAFYIFMYRQFFRTVPLELEEAARIDGCSIFRIYWNIFLPISLPVVATVTILTFHGNWNDIMGPFMYLREARYPLSTALSMVGYKPPGGDNQTIMQVTMAAGLLLALPIMVTFFIGQKYIVEGIVTTGIKG
ncbi:MAG: carbohydrate ABC transporter permease [Bacillota bacterium]|nr:carbohydrate ABC transporter permease [Bacillota bacterium]